MSVVQSTSPNTTEERKKVTTRLIQVMKTRHEPISMLTAYDYPTAVIMDQAGIDIILVGNSLGMVELGYESTLPVTMDDMIHHCKAVARGQNMPCWWEICPSCRIKHSPKKLCTMPGDFCKKPG